MLTVGFGFIHNVIVNNQTVVRVMEAQALFSFIEASWSSAL